MHLIKESYLEVFIPEHEQSITIVNFTATIYSNISMRNRLNNGSWSMRIMLQSQHVPVRALT